MVIVNVFMILSFCFIGAAIVMYILHAIFNKKVVSYNDNITKIEGKVTEIPQIPNYRKGQNQIFINFNGTVQNIMGNLM